jgi:transposase
MMGSFQRGKKFTSWKEIASHFQRHVQTVQRWEKQKALPIHRNLPREPFISNVYAYESELGAWASQPISRFKVTEADRAALNAWLAAGIAPRLALRAEVILASAAGEEVRSMARRLGTSPSTIAIWRRRYRLQGLGGLRTKPRSGRPRLISSAKERAVVSSTRRRREEATRWSSRRLAKKFLLSKDMVQRIWKKYGLRTTRFRFSCDPEVNPKPADLAGLYLNPPARALVLCVDENSQISASHVQRPMSTRSPARVTHDRSYSGATLLATLDILGCKVRPRCPERDANSEFIAFLESIDKCYPRRDLHLIYDSCESQADIWLCQWLALHPSFCFRRMSTRASWLHLIDRWFSLIERGSGGLQKITRLESEMISWLSRWDDAKSFRWVAPPLE